MVGSLAIFLLVVALITYLYSPNFVIPSDIMFIILIATLVDNIALLA